MNPTPRFCFLMERQVGIGSAAGAVEPHVRAHGHEWADVSYFEPGGILERLPLPGRSGGTLRGFAQTTAALRRGPYAALLFLTHNPAVFQPRALATTPTVLWTDVTPAELDAQAEQYAHPVDRSRLIGRLKAALVRNTFQRAALCVGWSNWARGSFVSDYGVPEQRTAVVPPGVDLMRWKPPSAKQIHGLPRLLFVGGDFERKGGTLLLDVYRAHLRGRCELDVVTRDPVAEEPGVRVHHGLTAGSAPLLSLYRKASVFVLPTLGDCFSIASLEAMAMGLPVVVSSVGGISDIVEHERSGFLIPPNDGRALCTALSALVTDTARSTEFGARGRTLTEQRFDAKKTATRLLELLSAISRSAPTPASESAH
jgi:glycosyltransferase involved in cell wall biosynthesis